MVVDVVTIVAPLEVHAGLEVVRAGDATPNDAPTSTSRRLVTVEVHFKSPDCWTGVGSAYAASGDTHDTRLPLVAVRRDVVTMCVPARKPTMANRPAPSVAAERTRSISTSLEASTVTPGMIAPDVS